MNPAKICFIYCVNNEQLLLESWSYIERLHVPRGFSIENRIARGAASMTAGYNWGMANSDAKYKVYLHQDVNIINPAFLHSIIHYFNKYPHLGLMGVIGAKILPHNGIWWESNLTYGKVYHFHKLLAGHEVIHDIECVKVVDGLILITQYDLPWREDIFKGWHLYDASQCLEFIKAGYQVGIPAQPQAWCIHNAYDNLTGYHENLQILIREYAPFMGN